MRFYAAATLGLMAFVLAWTATLDSGLTAVFRLPADAWAAARAAPGGELPGLLTDPLAWLLCAVVAAAATTLALIRDRAGRVLLLGSVGFGITGLFYFYAAPDLALTQLSVEIVSLVLFLLVLNLLPDESPGDRSQLLGRLVLAAAVGGTAAAATLLASAADRPPRPPLLADATSPADLGDYFLRNSYYGVDAARVAGPGAGVVDRGEGHPSGFGTKDPAKVSGLEPPSADPVHAHKGGGGANVVNVILVDFRGFDTLGEVAVLGLAAMGVWTLLRKPPRPGDEGGTDNRSEPADDTFIDPYGVPHRVPHAAAVLPRGQRAVHSERIASPILKTSARLLVPLAIVFAAYLFFKGHQSPGGGFVGGLATAVALVVFRMCFGCEALYRVLPVRERTLIGVGLGLAGLAAAAPLAFGLPLLTSTHGYLPLPGGGTFHWASVMVFDLGVYLIVVGTVVGMIDALARELE